MRALDRTSKEEQPIGDEQILGTALAEGDVLEAVEGLRGSVMVLAVLGEKRGDEAFRVTDEGIGRKGCDLSRYGFSSVIPT